MQTISIARLRAFHNASENAHAALISANDRARAARRLLQDARAALQLHLVTLHANAGSGDKLAAHEARLQKDVAAATDALNAALTAQAQTHDTWSHARALAGAGAKYAQELGMLPNDMAEFT